MKRISQSRGYKIFLIAILFISILISACTEKDKPAGKEKLQTQKTVKAERKVLFYRDPMNPSITSHVPAKDERGMEYIPVYVDEVKQPQTKKERKVLFYRNPMNPSITSPVPAKDEMGMEYIPVYADEVKAPEKKELNEHATVSLDEKGIHLAGIQTIKAVKQKFVKDIRAVGLVKADERRIYRVNTKNSGWIEKLYVNTTGELVKAGQPLLTIYSPELLASQEEFLRARENAASFATSSISEVRKGGEDLLKAARKRLELFDVPESFINEIEKTGITHRTVTLIVPVSGFVTAKQVYEGQRIERGMELFTVTDLSKIWIEADFYEFESRLIRIGQNGVISLAYNPGKELTGHISYIYPYLDPQSRTLKARFEFQNDGFSLKPDMYVNVSMKVVVPESIVIPDSAVINTGLRQIVFVNTGTDLFEPREIKTGYSSDGMSQVLSGVKAGEKVVTRANFLLDSESRLRAAILRSAEQSYNGGGSK